MKSKKVKWLIIITVLVMLAGGTYFLMRTEAVESSIVKVEPIEEVIKDTGMVKSQSMVDLVAYGSGEVLEIVAEIGAHVAEGDLLARLDDRLLQYQLESLSNQVKGVEVNVEYLASTYNELANDSVADSARIAQENFQKAKDDYDNGKLLFEAGAISKSELDSLELLYNVTRMSYTIALNEADTTTGGSDKNLDQYIYQLKSLEAQLEMLKLEIDRYEIKAPFDGVIGETYVDEREFIQAGMPVIQIYSEAYYVEANLLEDDLVRVNKETPVRIEDGEQIIEAKIIRIHPTIQKTVSDLGVSQSKGTIEILADIKVPIIGREVSVIFIVKSNPEAIALDKNAVVRMDGDPYVYKIENGRAVLVAVELGIKGTECYEVLEGVSENDRVILNPSEIIEDGTKVK
jgi:HlyD family secretion protein